MQSREYKAIGEKVYSAVLPNSLRLYVIPKPGFSKAFACFGTRYGGFDMRFMKGAEWKDTPAGIAHFLEHKMFEMPEGENALSVLAANGAEPNAFTGPGETVYHFESTDKFYDNLEMLLKFVSTPYFTPESVAKEQGIIGQEIMMIEDNPSFRNYMNLISCLYEHSPARTSIAGSIESIAQISAETLYDCYNTFYVPANMVLCAAGDVDPERIAEAAERILPKEPGNGDIKRDYGAEESLDAVTGYRKDKMEVGATLFMLGVKLPTPEAGEERRRISFLADLSCRAMAGTSSPLYSRLYEKGLINKSFTGETDNIPGTVPFIFAGESSEPEKVRDEIIAEAARIKRVGFDSDYIRRIKKSMAGGLLRRLDSLDDICCERLRGAFGGYDTFEDTETLMGVSEDEIAGFIAERIRPETLALSVIEHM
ncbi:MAG: insulinase family protein [Oscillospiraceae bacterium]|nr:insulinase family protein [Oscillospiraceae bacterium]